MADGIFNVFVAAVASVCGVVHKPKTDVPKEAKSRYCHSLWYKTNFFEIKNLLAWFADTDSRGLSQLSGRVPNTNKHSVEGSNPIWLQAYENEWYKNADDFRWVLHHFC